MQIVKPYARIVDPAIYWLSVSQATFKTFENLNNMQPDQVDVIAGKRHAGIQKLRKIESYGRVSHRSEDLQTENSWERLIQTVVLQHGDWSIVEHEKATVEFLVDRGITHELVRHRLFSYTQESTRFVNYTKEGHEPQFICPFEENTPAYNTWAMAIAAAEHDYKVSILNGHATPQLARSILPNSLASKIIMTGNLRSWRHFFIMRTTKESHPQMREVTIPLLQEFKEMFPLLYDDIQPETRQADNLRLPK